MGNMMFSPTEIANISGGRRPPAPKGYKLPEIFPSLNKAKRISLDLESLDESLSESKGPGWRRDAYIVGFGLGIGDKKGNIEFSEYYPLRHKGVANLAAERVYDWLSTELAFYTGEIVGANLLYDFDGFQYQRIQAPLAKFRDVQWAEALIDENAMSYRLNALAKKYLGESKVTEELKLLYGDDYIKRFHEVHPGHARTYGIGDIELPLKILFEQEKVLRKENLNELFDLECRLLPMLLYMRRLGVRVDLEQARKMNFELVAARDAAIASIAKKSGVGTDYENFGKPSIMKAIFDNLKIKYPYLLKGGDGKEKLVYGGDAGYEEAKLTGKPSFRKVWLEKGLEDQDQEIGDLIIRANIAEKARGTFVDGYITDNAIGDRVHCEFHPLRKKKDENSKSQGTITGRLSASNPNLQNIPARSEWIGPMCRKMFIADEGCDFFSADYCIAPETRILTANLEWKRANDIVVGEELIGCDEQPSISSTGHSVQRYARSTIVERVARLRQSCLRITTDRGTVVCSTQHRWLVKEGKFKLFSWKESQHIQPGHFISFMCSPWEEDRTNGGGYLSGLFDGEATLGWGSCSFNQNNSGYNSLVLNKGIELLKKRGYILNISPKKKGRARTTTCVRINGGREALLHFLGSIRPARLLAKARIVWEGHMLRSKTTPSARVLSVEMLGVRDVIALQTSKKTFIAEGFVSHNSQIEYRLLVHFAHEAKCTGSDIPVRDYNENPKMDFHEMCARRMYAEAWKIAEAAGDKKEMKKLRGPAKNLNFGMVYGMGAPLLAEQLGETNADGSPNDKALQIMKDYHESSPYIRELNKLCVKDAEDHQFITTIMGRRGRFPLWEPRFRDKGATFVTAKPYEEALALWGPKIKVVGTHKAMNKKIQGSAADMLKKAMVDIWESGLLSEGIHIELTVHDELDGSVERTDRAHQALKEMVHIMEASIPLHVPVMVSCETGPNWSETH